MAALANSPIDISEKRIYTCLEKMGKNGKKLETQKYSYCEQEFAKAFGFKIIETADDGNCFFDSLSKYGKKMKFEPLNKHMQTLREETVDYLHTVPELSIVYTEDDIEELRRSRVYACDAGDLPPQFANRAFGMNLHIYTFNHDEDLNINYITLVKNRGTIHRDVTVHVLHIGNHFKLLLTENEAATEFLIDDAALAERVHANEKANRNRSKALAEQQRNANRRTKKQNKNEMNSLEKALRNIKLAENAAKANAAKADTERKTRKNSNRANSKSRSRSRSQSRNDRYSNYILLNSMDDFEAEKDRKVFTADYLKQLISHMVEKLKKYNIDTHKFSIKGKPVKRDLINMYRELRQLYLVFRGQ
jgi:hypothetical protein